MNVTRFWTSVDRPFGFLLLEAGDGGHCVTVRAWRWCLRVEADAWVSKQGQ